MTDSFVRFGVSPAGRAPLVGAGALVVCVLGPALGYPLSGAAARAAP